MTQAEGELQYSGGRGAQPEHHCTQTSAVRDFLSTPRFNSLLLFFFSSRKKKWNRNFKHMKFHTGNESETTDTADLTERGGISVEDMLKAEVTKLMNELRE